MKMYLKSIYLVLLIGLSVNDTATAKTILTLDGSQQKIPLVNYLSVYEDIESKLTIENISNPEMQKKFQVSQTGNLNKGSSNSTFWTKLHLRNDTNHLLRKILKSKYSTISYLDLFIPIGSTDSFQQVSSGFLFPYSNKPISSESLAFELELEANQEKIIYFRFNSVTSINLEMELLSVSKFAELEINQSYFIGGFYSILFTLLLANLLINILFKKKFHLYLLVFISSLIVVFSIVDGLSLSFFQGLSAFGPMQFIVLFSCIALASLLYFCRSFALDTYQNKLVLFSHYFILSTLVITAAVAFLFGYLTAKPFYIFSGVITPLFLLVIAITTWKLNKHTSYIYLLGIFLLFVGVALQILFRLGFVENISYIDQSARIGMLLFLLFMSLTIVDFVQGLQLRDKHILSALSKSETRHLTSEEKFTKSFYHLPIPMQMIDYQTAERVAVNDSFYELTGYSADEILNSPFFEVDILVDKDAAKIHLAQLVSSGELLNIPITLKHKNGDLIHTLLSGTILDIESQNLALISINDVTQQMKQEKAIYEIASGVASATNEDFLNHLILQLSSLFEADYVFIGLVNETNPDIIDTKNFCENGIITQNFSYELTGTPCANVVGQKMCSYPCDVSEFFPNDKMIVEMGIEGYVGTPLNDSNGNNLGLLVVLKKSPMEKIENLKEMLKIFASRVASEIERAASESKLREVQQKLSLHIKQTPLAAIEWNKNFEVVSWNAAAEHIFGYSEEEVLGRSAKDLIIPDEFIHHVDAIWNDLLNMQGGLRSSNKNITKQGSIIFCEWYNTPLITDSGEVIGVASLAADKTSEQSIKEGLIQKEKEQTAIFSSIFDGVITIDENGIILSCNESVLRITGYSEVDLLGKNVIHFVSNKITNNYQTEADFMKYLISIHSTELKTVESIGIRKNQSKYPMRVSIVELKSDTKEGKIYVLSIHDLSESKLQEEQLRRSQKMDALGKLTGGIAHDFNNLLAVIIGYSDLLDKTIKPDTNQSRYSLQIHRAAERGAKLTKKLLGFSRTKRTETTVVNINELLLSQVHLLEKTLTSRIKLQFEFSDELLNTNIDASDFEDAILNLCINAMHAIDGTGQITIQTSKEVIKGSDAKSLQVDAGEYVLVQVKDSGCGIERKILDNIFDPFFTTKGEEGTGLGLSQVYGFVQNSQGAIKVYSELEEGSQFTLYFESTNASDISTIQSTTEKSLDLFGTETILVVDDEEPIRLMSEEILLQNGYKVYTAESAKQALELLKSRNFDLLLSDVIMPKMDGYELAKIVQKKYPEVKIQLASGFTDNRQKDRKQELYFKQLLQKPFSANTLLLTIRKLLDNKS